jgi:Sulfocyanin (SoxE) domain
MLISTRLAGSVSAFGVFLGVLVGACSREEERPVAAETTGSITPASSPETVATPADTRASPMAQASSSDSPAPRKPPVKPSIDPGRKASPAQPTVTVPKPAPVAPAAAPAAAPPAVDPAQGQYLKYDGATNTVTFDLIGGPTGFQFNGYSSGGATLVLPPKANVVMNFVNKDGTPHSAQVISGEGPIPNAAVDAAIPRAYTNKVLEGLPQEGSDVMRFTVPESGTYRIFCGVPGHGLSGMWIWMKVDPAAKAPSFGPTKS